jgi:hypothetical protein
MELPDNKYRIRVRQDEPPQVWFESPAEALEVHSLAEVLMRIRVSDDFGLARAGVMFEVNNEEEYPLIGQDFQAAQDAAKELKATGKLSPQTRATLEKVLPLEHFKLTQQDSVMYYAFAEDNRPSGSQRTETDLRFVDIRPFRRLYRVLDTADGTMTNQGPQLKSLEELIARQRHALNRTKVLAKQLKRGQSELAGVDALIKFQGELAKFTRELAQGLEARGIDETELLYEAEAAMLQATDSLTVGNYDTAELQERDALKHLIEGRNRLEVSIRKNPNRQQLAQLRQFDRTQQQKLRRPKTDQEEARDVAERLKKLADEEDFVYRTLAGVPMSGTGDEEGDPSSSSDKKQEAPMKAREEGATGSGEKPKEKDAAKAKEGEKKEGPAKEAGNDEPKPKSAKSGADSGKKEVGQEGAGKNDTAKDDTGKGGGKEAAKDRTKSKPEKALSSEELKNRQADVVVEAEDVTKAFAKLKNITDLAKERMDAATQTAKEAASALEGGDDRVAQEKTDKARGQFRELAAQVRALMAEEQAQRIAAAQQMATQLAREQQDFADRLANKSDQNGAGGDQPPKKKQDDAPGKGKKETPKKDKPNMQGLGSDAEKIAERAKTLADILGVASKADNPEDQASAKKVGDLMGELKLPDLTQRLQDIRGQVGRGKLEDAKATVGDGAERMEAAAAKLAEIHRDIVAPQVAELAKVEKGLKDAEEELDHLDAPMRITRWHMDTTALLDELDKLGISKELRDQFLEEMRKAGWGPDVRTAGWTWGRTDGGYYAAPVVYRNLLTRLLGSVQGRMQELMLLDLPSSRDEPIPPQYQDLVDRYQKLLSSDGKDRAKRMVRPQK